MGEWQVETKMLDGWDNVWTMTFETKHEAQQELDCHLKLYAAAYASGDVVSAPE